MVTISIGEVYLNSTSPSQITSDQNNYAPSGWNTSGVLRLDADSSFRTITGLGDATQTGEYRLRLRNISANTILLGNQNAGSTAANRFDFGGYDIPLFSKSQLEVVYDSTLARWVTANPYAYVIPTRLQGHYNTWEALGLNASEGGSGSLIAASGGGAANQAGTVGHSGNRRWTLGTSTTGSGSFMINPDNLILGNSWYWRFDGILKIIGLSDGTNTYTLRVGFLDSTTAESTDGVFFKYTHTLNSGQWVCVARDNGSETTSNTSSTVGTTNYTRLTIIVNPAGNSAQFFVDGTAVGTPLTALPTGSTEQTGFGFMFLKSAGTANNVLLDIDAFDTIGYANTLRTT